ncbi:hypothetical protein KPL42_18035 [Clostridium gasigenes]|uniref:hypothetical protein n=1 Tax=Clostridium gasigenes TaxID=94869 RepID=UPI001C0B8C0A|nr:hypothetical protein [Clostridium gasigenes]MBU3090370.1 hypothetical protein [Clostridium gasigenes]
MSKEQYNKIISNAKDTLCESILEKISEFKYKELDGYYVIQVYVKSEIKAKEMGEILTNISKRHLWRRKNPRGGGYSQVQVK